MNVWKFINPGDAYDKGYECGIFDGKEKKTRNAPWQEEIKYLTAVFNREHFWKSFHEGYNTGYTDGLRIRHQILSEQEILLINQNSKPLKMARNSSIDYQIQLLEELKKSLDAFSSNLDAVTDRYEKKLQNLESNGLLIELYEHYYTTCFEPTKTRINGLKQNIIDNDLKEIDRIIEKIGHII